METTLYTIPSNNASFNQRIRTITRKCSFCNCQGHNITACNDQSLISFRDYLINFKTEFLLVNDNNEIVVIRELENYLYNFSSQSNINIKLIKAFACRFCDTRLRSILQVCINKIIMYLFNIDCISITLHEYNFIPFNHETPVRISNIIEGILLNYYANNQIEQNGQTIGNLNQLNFDTLYEINLENCDNSNNDVPLDVEIECSICYNATKKYNTAKLDCHHEYCIDCTHQLLLKDHTNCPFCRKKIDKLTCYNEEAYKKLNSFKNI